MMKKTILAISLVSLISIVPLLPTAFADDGYYPDFLNFFLSDFFFETLIAITIAGYLGHLTNSGIAFGASLLVILTILTFAGAYPFWLLLVITLISGMIMYALNKGEGGGK